MNQVALGVHLVTSILVSAQSPDSVCSVVLQSNTFNVLDEEITANVAFAKRDQICSRDYASSSEFRKTAASGGFRLLYNGFGLGASGGKASGSGRYHFREEAFCKDSRADFDQAYSLKRREVYAGAALAAWTECINTSRKNSLWLAYTISPDGTGMTGHIFRTLNTGRTQIKITSMQVHPDVHATEVRCDIENRTISVAYFRQHREGLKLDTTKEAISCTKPANIRASVSFDTDGSSLNFVRLESAKNVESARLEQLQSDIARFRASTETLAKKLNATAAQQLNMWHLNFTTQNQAQGSCVAIARARNKFGWVTAVARTCSAQAPTCSSICSTLKSRTTDQQLLDCKKHELIGSLHVYEDQPTGVLDRVGLKTFVYDDSAGARPFCGPNYCCCISG